MSQAVALYRVYELPWTTGEEQERSFRRVLLRSVVAVLALAIVFGLLPLPERAADDFEEIPQRFARLVVDRPPPPPPPVVREEPEPPPEPVPDEEPERIVEERVVEPDPVEPTPEPEPRPADRVVEARERASVAGLLPFAQQLASLRDNDALERLDRAEAVSAGGDAPVAERSLITSRVGSRSGGIDTAALSRDTGGAGLAGRATTRVENPVEGLAAAGPGAARSGSSTLPSRSREEIERVFDRNKGAIFALYNRALRQNPALEGKLVLRLTIAPDGRVTFCEVVSSELGDPELEQRLVQRVLLFQFDAKDVEPITTTKPIDFFPA